MSDKPKNLSDIDSFWDLNSLLPKKRPVAPSVRQPNTDTALIDVGDDTAPADAGSRIPPRDGNESIGAHSSRDTARRLNEIPLRSRAQEHRSKPQDPYLIYTPSSRHIRRVEVAKWDSHFNFYENFRNDAARLWGRTVTECPRVSFFSYIPQYSQLKYAQLKWYLWWRENVRHGVYLCTDFCYILLYVYEIINSPDLLPPKKGVELLCDIWLNYRSEHRRIDSYMCEWLCDYCLIHELPCPTERLEPIIGDIVAAASFKEFYMDTADSTTVGAGILAYTSTYDWRKSRYVTSETLPIFAKHIRGAFDKAYREIISGDGGEFAKEIRIERSSYDGALCVYDIKRTIAVEYISYTRSPRFKFVVTDIIKYSENRVRMALGIKSRLKVVDLTDKLRKCIDDYFDEYLPAPKKTRVSAAADVARAAEYEKLYEPVSAPLSLENALKIEAESWSTTDALTSAFDEDSSTAPDIPSGQAEEIYQIPHQENAPEACGDDEFSELISQLSDKARLALTLIANGDIMGIKKAAEQVGMLADAMADMINETAFDIIGDSVIEPTDGGYRLISDYKGDIEKWLK